MGGREATEGTVQSYIHGNGKVGVLVEVDCNTDFVARNEDFIAFAREVALHIAASPTIRYVSEDDDPGGRQGGRAARLRAAGRRQARERPRADRRGQAAQVDRGGRPAQPAARQRRQARGKTIEQLRAELSGTTGRERRHPPLRPLRRGGLARDGPARLRAHPAQALRRGPHGRLRTAPIRSGRGRSRTRSSTCTTAASRSRSCSARATSSAASRPPRPGMDRATGDYMGMLATCSTR